MEVILGVEREMVMGDDKLEELSMELSGEQGARSMLVEKVFYG